MLQNHTMKQSCVFFLIHAMALALVLNPLAGLAADPVTITGKFNVTSETAWCRTLVFNKDGTVDVTTQSRFGKSEMRDGKRTDVPEFNTARATYNAIPLKSFDIDAFAKSFDENSRKAQTPFLEKLRSFQAKSYELLIFVNGDLPIFLVKKDNELVDVSNGWVFKKAWW